ncbi:MAG: hypothetical protein ACW97O_16440, partial [Candidatus Thorarchaeota archaeon]
MGTPSSFDQMNRDELLEECRHLQKALEEQKRTAASWIETLSSVAQTDQSMSKSLTKGLRLIIKTSHMEGAYIHLCDPHERVLKLKASIGLTRKSKD